VMQSVTHEQSHRDISIPYLDYYSNYAYLAWRP